MFTLHKSNRPWGLCVIYPFNFHLKSKIENWCQFLIFITFIIKIRKFPIQNFWLFFPFDRILKHNLFFTLILSTIKRKMKLSGNFTFLTMLQSVVWFRKIENWKLQSIFNFCFSAKTLKITNITTQEGGRGVHLHSNFFCPCPPPSPPLLSHTTLLWKGGSGKFVFTMQSLFHHKPP